MIRNWQWWIHEFFFVLKSFMSISTQHVFCIVAFFYYKFSNAWETSKFEVGAPIE